MLHCSLSHQHGIKWVIFIENNVVNYLGEIFSAQLQSGLSFSVLISFMTVENWIFYGLLFGVVHKWCLIFREEGGSDTVWQFHTKEKNCDRGEEEI